MLGYKKSLSILGAMAVSAGLVGCNVDDVIVGVDIADKAYFKFVNNTNASMTYYINSVRQDNGLFRDEYRTSDVVPQDFSQSHKYVWVKGFSNSRVGVEDTNSGSSRDETRISLRDKRDYWAIAWTLNSGNVQISTFEQETNNVANEFTVRIFANAELDVFIGPSTTKVDTTEIGLVSGFYAVQNCDDLTVGNIAVNLCQSADLGFSYLVVIDQNGDVVVAKES